jgi:hypothetical protein
MQDAATALLNMTGRIHRDETGSWSAAPQAVFPRIGASLAGEAKLAGTYVCGGTSAVDELIDAPQTRDVRTQAESTGRSTEPTAAVDEPRKPTMWP